MTIEHKNITNANLHEPLGALAASVGQTYIANGSGGGTWKKVSTDEIDTNSIKALNKMVVTLEIADVTLEIDYYLVLPIAGLIEKAWLVSDNSSAGPFTVVMSIGGTGVTNGTITVAGGGAVGEVDSIVPSANNTFVVGDTIKFVVAGAPAGNSRAQISLLLDVS